MDKRIPLLAGIFLLSSIYVYSAIRVSWEPYPDPSPDPPNVAGYAVFRATDSPSNGYIQVSPTNALVTNTFFLDEGALGFHAFFYLVAAIDENGDPIDDQYATSCVVHYCHGDANLSGFVDVADAVLLEQWITTGALPEAPSQEFYAADANLDGYLDVADLVRIRRIIVELDAQEAHCIVAQ